MHQLPISFYEEQFAIAYQKHYLEALAMVIILSRTIRTYTYDNLLGFENVCQIEAYFYEWIFVFTL